WRRPRGLEGYWHRVPASILGAVGLLAGLVLAELAFPRGAAGGLGALELVTLELATLALEHLALPGPGFRRRFLPRFDPAHQRWVVADAHLAQVGEGFPGHAFRQVHGGESLVDLDAADVLAVDIRLVGDGAHHVLGLHAVV